MLWTLGESSDESFEKVLGNSIDKLHSIKALIFQFDLSFCYSKIFTLFYITKY